jgi:hypothetical protein
MEKRNREVINNVDENEQLQRLHVSNSSSLQIFTAQVTGFTHQEPCAPEKFRIKMSEQIHGTFEVMTN